MKRNCFLQFLFIFTIVGILDCFAKTALYNRVLGNKTAVSSLLIVVRF